MVWRIPAEQFSPSNDPGYCLRVDRVHSKPEDFRWILRISPKSPTYLWMSPYISTPHLSLLQRFEVCLPDFPDFGGKFSIFWQIPPSPCHPPVPKLLKGGHWRHCQKYEYICDTPEIIKGNSYFGCKSSNYSENQPVFPLNLWICAHVKIWPTIAISY